MSSSIRTPLKVLDGNQRQQSMQSGVTTPGKMIGAATPGKGMGANLQETNLKLAAENKVLLEAKKDMEMKLHEILDEYETLRSEFSLLEESNHKMKVTIINLEEESVEYKNSYDKLQEEGRELFQTYERKCTALKQSGLQLEECKAALVDREQKLKTVDADLRAACAERDELKVKLQMHLDATSKNELRYLSLKDEHNQNLARIDSLMMQLTQMKEEAAARPATPLQNSVSENAVDQLHAQAASAESSTVVDDDSFCQNVALPFTTPVRPSSRVPCTPKLVAKTPGGVFRDLEAMSPSGLREHAESLVISNDLLRQELVQSREKNTALSAEVSRLELASADFQRAVNIANAAEQSSSSKLSDALKRRDEAVNAEAETRRALQGVKIMEKEELERLRQELIAATELKEEAEQRMDNIEQEKQVLVKKLASQTESTKNAENDMRLMYKRHKKEMQELSEKFKEGMYEDRYQKAVAKANRLAAMVDGWAGFARELNETRMLQAEFHSINERTAEDLQKLIAQFKEAKSASDEKVMRWMKQTRRMEGDMTKLVRIKTKALEDKKLLQEKLQEFAEELTAQGEYAMKLEENEKNILQQCEQDKAQLQEQLEAITQQRLDECNAVHRDEVAELTREMERIEGREREVEVRITLESMISNVEREGLQHQLSQTEENIVLLESQVQDLNCAAEASDNMFADATSMVQERDETIRALQHQVEEATKEVQQLRDVIKDTQTFREAEDSAAQDALDELTRALCEAQENLSTTQDLAETYQQQEKACKLAAACGIARLTHITVGMAPEEDDTTQMIDPELRLNWCDNDYEYKLAESKTGLELRALLVGLASTVELLLTRAQHRQNSLLEQVGSQKEQNKALNVQIQALQRDKDMDTEAKMHAISRVSELETACEEARAREAEAKEEVAALQERLSELQAQGEAELATVSALMDKKEALERIVEATTRENLALENFKLEAEVLQDTVRDLNIQLEDAITRCNDAEEQAEQSEQNVEQISAERDKLREKAEKRLTVLKQNLQRSESECASLDALLAHVKGVLHMHLDTPGADVAPLRNLLRRLSPDDSQFDS